MNPELIYTKDGSQSLFLPELNEHYHSIHGAKTESEHIFIQEGLCQVDEKVQQIHVLEIGMGTGLNVLCTYVASEIMQRYVQMHTLEKYPLKDDIWLALNYPSFWPELPAIQKVYQHIHEQPFEQEFSLGSFMSLQKMKISLHDFIPEQRYHLIYFDAFAPEKQPDMWTREVFQKMYNCLLPQGMLVTYCCKGVIRRLLQEIGFVIQKVPGPVGGKREMLRAYKN